MYVRMLVMLGIGLLATGCDAGSDAPDKPPQVNSSQGGATGRGGTITVGEDSWTIVPAIQCSVYGGNVVNIAGHAAEDPGLEIVIDHGGPDQVRVGSDSGGLWHAVRDSIEITIDGRRVSGRAMFTSSPFGTGDAVQGSYEVNCG